MSIRWDSLLVHYVAEELNHVLAGARLKALRLDGAARDVVFLFRERTLLWRLHPTRGYPLLGPPIEPGERDLPFGFRLRRIGAPPDERIVRFELLPTRGSRGRRDLIVELLGNQWNAIVVDPDSGIVRHVLWTRSGKRGPLVGHPYEPPAAVPRAGIGGELSQDAWAKLVGDGPRTVQATNLIAGVSWTSPLNVDSVLGPPAQPADLKEAYRRWKGLVPPGLPEPVILSTDRGPQPYPLPLPGMSHEPVAALMPGFEALASTGPSSEAHEDAPNLLLPLEVARRLERALVQASRRVRRLNREVGSLEDAEALRRTGDLILARYREIEAGAGSATLIDFDGNEVLVELDPGEDPHETAARYYRRAGKSERARARIPGLLEEAEAKLAALTELRRRVVDGSVEPEEILASLPRLPVRTPGTDERAGLPYRTFRSSGGLEIRVGRGARHNDDLTFHHSAPHDIWLHARHAAGAHVVLRWSGPGNPPAKDLQEAACLAALHSKARTSGSVPVDWTLRKYVRKPRGSAPGKVAPERVKTLFVEPDPKLADTLGFR